MMKILKIIKKERNKKPRGIVLDYETSPQLGWFWGKIWETNIIKVEQHTQIICGAWKEHGIDKINFISQRDFKGYKPGVLDDYQLCEYFQNLINEFDYVVAQNGDAFDIRVLNTRLAFHGIPQVSTTKSFDTMKMSRNNLYLPSNKLNDIAEFFGIGEKLSTNKDLWFDCMAGDKKAWGLMEKYNKQDVVLCDELYTKLLPYTKQFNTYIRMNNIDINCSNPDCLSGNLIKHKRNKVVNGWKMQYQCRDCGRYTTDTKIIKEGDK